MSDGQPFQQIGLTATITTAGANTSQSTLVKFSDLGLSQQPRGIRVINNGAADIWMSITKQAAAAAFPIAGTTTVGTPSAGKRLKPGVIEAFTLGDPMSANVDGLGNGGFFINTISPTAAQSFDVTPGEGG